jgi:hypothetical protein
LPFTAWQVLRPALVAIASGVAAGAERESD